jgi:hypothetical protein
VYTADLPPTVNDFRANGCFDMWMTSMLAPARTVSSSRVGRGARAPFGCFLEAVRRGLRNLTLSAILVDEVE